MALHHDLLEQALHLATREARKPKQASLRRAVSSAYYALFHLLVAEAAQRLAPAQPPLLRRQVARAFAHGQMRQVCESIRRRQPPAPLDALLALPIEPDLAIVAQTFPVLQQARHDADYNLAAVLSRVDVRQNIKQAELAFSSWKTVRSGPNATVFLTALLLHGHGQWR